MIYLIVASSKLASSEKKKKKRQAVDTRVDLSSKIPKKDIFQRILYSGKYTVIPYMVLIFFSAFEC